MNSPITLTVSQLNEYVGAVITSCDLLSDIYIKGEISNFTNHYKSGHFYFTLKDESSTLRAVMFRSNAYRVPFTPENGMKVCAHGRISVYERDGVYQLYCDELIPDGVGALYLAYEQLKAKLAEEGLFNDEYKKPIRRYPERIGIITAKTGAAIADITNILSRRYPLCETELYPALVQGAGAAATLIEGIKYLDGRVDTIIIGRGGGSIEDLWAFNDERLARAIFACKTPVISAVGHEVDFTICDFVADLRAPTPSAAAELAVPDISELSAMLSGYENRLKYSITNKLSVYRDRLKAVTDSAFFRSPNAYLDKKRSDLLNCEIRFQTSSERICEPGRNSISRLSARLSALNPLAVLARGYAAVYTSSGKIACGVDGITLGENVKLKMSDGEAFATVCEIVKDKN